MDLNRKQKKAMWIGIACVVAAGLFPPWGETYGSTTKRFKFYGYSAIFTPATKAGSLSGSVLSAPDIDYNRLLLEFGVIGLVTAAAVVSLKDSSSSLVQNTAAERSDSEQEQPISAAAKSKPNQQWVLVTIPVVVFTAMLIFGSFRGPASPPATVPPPPMDELKAPTTSDTDPNLNVFDQFDRKKSDGKRILFVSPDGGVIGLTDGTVWNVSPYDHEVSWKKDDHLRVEGTTSPIFINESRKFEIRKVSIVH